MRAARPGIGWAGPDFDPARRAFGYARVIGSPAPCGGACDRVKFEPGLPPEIRLKTR